MKSLLASFCGVDGPDKVLQVAGIERRIIPNDIRHQVCEEVFFLIALRRAHVDGSRAPVLLTTIAVSFLEVFQIFAYPWLVAVAEIYKRRVTLAQVLVVIVHERRRSITVEPRNHFEVLLEQVFLDWSDETAIAVFTDQINLFQF